jgi:hypothetical protein
VRAIATVHVSGINWETLVIQGVALLAATTTILVNLRLLRHKLNGHLEDHMRLSREASNGRHSASEGPYGGDPGPGAGSSPE